MTQSSKQSYGNYYEINGTGHGQGQAVGHTELQSLLCVIARGRIPVPRTAMKVLH
jgi:hypothetical protein